MRAMKNHAQSRPLMGFDNEFCTYVLSRAQISSFSFTLSDTGVVYYTNEELPHIAIIRQANLPIVQVPPENFEHYEEKCALEVVLEKIDDRDLVNLEHPIDDDQPTKVVESVQGEAEDAIVYKDVAIGFQLKGPRLHDIVSIHQARATQAILKAAWKRKHLYRKQMYLTEKLFTSSSNLVRNAGLQPYIGSFRKVLKREKPNRVLLFIHEWDDPGIRGKLRLTEVLNAQ